MKFHRPLRPWSIGALLALCLAAQASRAAMIDITDGSWSGSSTARTETLVARDFLATRDGTVTLSVADVNVLTGGLWGTALSSLVVTLTPYEGPRQVLVGAAMLVFEIGANKPFTVSTYAAVPSGMGAYKLDLVFVPKVAPVPLPLGGWLLLSGAGLLGAVGRRARPGSWLRPATA